MFSVTMIQEVSHMSDAEISVRTEIFQIAETLGLDPEGDVVSKALETGALAIQEAFGVEVALELARNVLTRETHAA